MPAVFSPRSIPAFSPPLDRLVVRAALAKEAAWPRTGPGLAHAVTDAIGRPDATAQWVAEPAASLLGALRERIGPDALIAAPAWGCAGLASLPDGPVHWMQPAHHRLDPGKSQVAEALAAGARAIVLAPVAGDCAGLLGIAELCRAHDALFVLDARGSAGGRVLDGSPALLGDLTLASLDGEPGPSPCPGAILFGAPQVSNGRPGMSPGSHAVDLLRDSLRSEPRLHRLLRPPRRDPRSRAHGPAPSWAFAAAAARLQQSALRASQRARHGKVLRDSIQWIEGVDLPLDPPGVQSAGGTLGLLVEHRDDVADRLAALGVPSSVGGLWLAPPGAREGRAALVAARALSLPLLPFYRPVDLDFIGECLRKAALGAKSAQNASSSASSTSH